MRIRVAVTVKLSREQVKSLVKVAKCHGYGYDECKTPGRLIRRYLEGLIDDALAYCHERAGDDEPD